MESPIADLHFDLHKISEDNLYDVIFCNHVLEHVEDDHQCMKELYRVMKAGGWGIFQVQLITIKSPMKTLQSPILKKRNSLLAKDHVRLYGLDYPKKLEKAGFKVDVFDPKTSLEDVDYEIELNSSNSFL